MLNLSDLTFYFNFGIENSQNLRFFHFNKLKFSHWCLISAKFMLGTNNLIYQVGSYNKKQDMLNY